MSKNTKLLIVVFVCFLTVVGYLVYDKFSLSEDEAKKAVSAFYSMSKMGNIDSSLYPTNSKIRSQIKLTHEFVINNTYKNDETGMYDVYVEYIHNEVHKYPIVFSVEKKWGKITITSSRGLCNYLYNGVFDLGVTLGEIDRNANDEQISQTIFDKSLDKFYEDAEVFGMVILNSKISLSANNRYNDFGILSMIATLKNNSGYSLNSDDLDCGINFVGVYGDVIKSQKIYFVSGIPPQQMSNMIVNTPIYDNWTEYQPTLKILKTDNVKGILKDIVINLVKNKQILIDVNNKTIEIAPTL